MIATLSPGGLFKRLQEAREGDYGLHLSNSSSDLQPISFPALKTVLYIQFLSPPDIMTLWMASVLLVPLLGRDVAFSFLVFAKLVATLIPTLNF